MKKKSAKRSRSNPKLSKSLIIFCIVLISLFAFKFIAYELRSVKETPRSQTSKIPKEIKKNLKPNPEISYKVPILMYHYVENVTDERDTFRKSMNIEPQIFESQIKTLHDNGYTFLTTEELSAIIDGYRKMPKKAVVVTFDDGHFDNATVVLPILKKYNARATFYIIPGFINDQYFLSDSQMKEIIDSNRVEIGAHTVHHISLTGKLFPLIIYEATQSKKMLEQKYGITVTSFAYPNGDFDETAISVVKNAGFSTAVSTIPGTGQSLENRYFLFRLRPAYRTGQDLINFFDQESFAPYN